MTILTAINEVGDVVGLDPFTSVYGADDANAKTMMEIAKQAGDEIARRVDWQRMLKQVTPSVAVYVLPDDYNRMTPGGALRSPTGEFARPVLSSGQWAVISAVPSAQPYFFIKANVIGISPVSFAATAIMDYVSKNWIKTNAGIEKDTFSADDDTVLFPERLLIKNILWRWRRQKGFEFEDFLSEFEADLIAEIRADRGDQ
jgi:hypothetical protein